MIRDDLKELNDPIANLRGDIGRTVRGEGGLDGIDGAHLERSEQLSRGRRPHQRDVRQRGADVALFHDALMLVKLVPDAGLAGELESAVQAPMGGKLCWSASAPVAEQGSGSRSWPGDWRSSAVYRRRWCRRRSNACGAVLLRADGSGDHDAGEERVALGPVRARRLGDTLVPGDGTSSRPATAPAFLDWRIRRPLASSERIDRAGETKRLKYVLIATPPR